MRRKRAVFRVRSAESPNGARGLKDADEAAQHICAQIEAHVRKRAGEVRVGDAITLPLGAVVTVAETHVWADGRVSWRYEPSNDHPGSVVTISDPEATVIGPCATCEGAGFVIRGQYPWTSNDVAPCPDCTLAALSAATPKEEK